MAFSAELGSLVEELVDAVNSRSPRVIQDISITKDRLRDSIVRTLQSRTHLRTNQFIVATTLDGLEERFLVNDREALADALQDKRQALQLNPAPWHPEILSLLLELSDQPTFHTRISDVYQLRHKDTAGDDDAPLLWDDIAAEEGWDQNAGLWETIKYDGNSDDYDEDDSYNDETADDHDTTNDTEMTHAAPQTSRNPIVRTEDVALLEAIQDSQSWRLGASANAGSGKSSKIAVGELDVFHEVLFMLQGLETSLFDADCSLNPKYQIRNLCWETHKALLNTFAEDGRHLLVLRSFVTGRQDMPHLQAFQSSVEARLRLFDERITFLQTKLGCPTDDMIVSLAALKEDLRPAVEPLLRLARVIQDAELGSSEMCPFRYLDSLYDGAVMAQLSGTTKTFEFLARIFLESFSVCIRPIREWMCNGRLPQGDQPFFVAESAGDVSPGNLWRGRFQLRYDASGEILAPRFLRPAVTKIFNAGKTVVVLSRLGQQRAAQAADPEDVFAFEAVCPPGIDLAPFSTLFELAFERWIDSKYDKASTTLKDVVFAKWGLASSLDMLQTVYLQSDGSAAAVFFESVFNQIDSGESRWYDHRTLTNLAQETWSESFDSTRLSVEIGDAGRAASLQAARETLRLALPSIKFHCRLPWVLQMIVSSESIKQYQSAFTFLLQLRRTMYILQQRKILENYWTDHKHWERQTLYYKCRGKLIWFCTAVQTHLVTLVLRPSILQMQHDMDTAADIDAMSSSHDAFTKRIVDEACLGSRLVPIHNVILDVLDLGLEVEFACEEHAKGSEAFTSLLKEVLMKFEKHLNFICEGLRSVARATSESPAAKWNMLAELLEPGR